MPTESSKTRTYPAPADVLATYAELHTTAPKLFPAWGSRNSIKAPLWVNWSRLARKNPWDALAAATQLVHAAGLEWAYDSRGFTVTVKDGVNEFSVGGRTDVRVSLMMALRLMIVRRRELMDPDTWASYDHPPRPKVYARPISDLLPPLDVLDAWATLHLLAPKLFPEWGTPNDEAAPLWTNWQELGETDPDRAAAEVFGLLRRLGLTWKWDSKRGTVAVQDAQGSYGYHDNIADQGDVRLALLDGLTDLLTDWPELGNPELWPDGNPPRRPEIVHGPNGLEMDGELILPAEPPRDDTAWNAAVAECNATIKTAVQKLSEAK